jgi:hypothetical protein
MAQVRLFLGMPKNSSFLHGMNELNIWEIYTSSSYFEVSKLDAASLGARRIVSIRFQKALFFVPL